MRDREGRHITNEAVDEISVGGTPISIRDSFEYIVQQLSVDPFDNVADDGYYPGDSYGGETGGVEPRLMLDIDSSGYLGATTEQEGEEALLFRVMIRNNYYIPQWKNGWDDVWNYFPDDDELGTPRNYPTYGGACEFIRRFSHINVGNIPLTNIIGRGDLPDEKIYLYYR